MLVFSDNNHGVVVVVIVVGKKGGFEKKVDWSISEGLSFWSRLGVMEGTRKK